MKSRCRFIPRLQTLEDRTVLSGTVSASVVGDVLQITGDNAGNVIGVRQLPTGQWRVGGDQTTLINRTSRQFITPGPVASISIQMHDGNDTVELPNGNLSGRLDIAMGGGNDLTRLTSVTASFAQIDLDAATEPAGRNFLYVTNCRFRDVVTGGLIVNGGDLSDVVFMSQVQTDRLEVSLHSGIAQIVRGDEVTATSNRLTAGPTGSAGLRLSRCDLGPADPGTPSGFTAFTRRLGLGRFLSLLRKVITAPQAGAFESSTARDIAFLATGPASE